MELEFCITHGANKGRSFSLPTGANLMFGRSKAVQCQIDDPDIALAHFEVRVENGKIWLTDCGSRAGTKVNGRGANELELQLSDRIKIGNTELCLQETGVPGLKEPGTTMGSTPTENRGLGNSSPLDGLPTITSAARQHPSANLRQTVMAL